MVKEKSKLSAWAGVDASASTNAHANAPKVIFFMTRSQVVTPRKKTSRLRDAIWIVSLVAYQVCTSKTDAACARCAERSGDLLPPSPPGKKATASGHEARQTSAHQGTRNLAV